MQLKLDLAAAVKQHISTPDSALLSYPNGPWGRGVDMSVIGDQTNANPQYIFSNGGLVAGAVNVAYHPTAEPDATIRNRIAVYTGSGTTSKILSASTFPPNSTPFLWLQREGELCTLYSCPALTSAPADGSMVVNEGSFAVNIGYDGPTGFYVGARGDLTTTRMSAQAFGRLLMTNERALTTHEIAKLAFGMSLSNLGIAPLVQAAPTAQGTFIDSGPNAFVFTVAGTPSVIEGPTFGYTSGAQPVDAMTVVAMIAERGYQRLGTSATVAMSGTWSGTKPTSIEYQLRSEDGAAILKAWTAIVGVTINDNGTWSGAPAIPQGGMYRREMRTKNGTTVLAPSALEANPFGVGDFILYAGSSSAERMFTSSGGTGLTPAANIRKFDENGFAKFGTVGAAITVANSLAAQAGVPIFMMDYGIGATTLAQWLVTDGAQWTPVIAGVAQVGGKIAGAVFTMGSNDVGDNLVTSVVQHRDKLRQAITNIRALTGQPTLHICLSGFNRRGSVNTNQANWARTAENIVGDDTNVTHVQTMDFPILTSDNTHLTTAGFIAKGARIGAVWGRRVYGDGVYMRGPKAAAFTWTGNTVRIPITHRNGNDFTPTTGILYFSGSDDSGALTFTAARSAANEIVATGDRAIVGTLNFDYLGGGNPGTGTQVFDNGTTSLPMHVETEILATPQGSAPSTSRTVTCTLCNDQGPAANLTNMKVSFHAASGPHETAAALFQSGIETTDGAGVLSFSFDSNAINVGDQGLLAVLMGDGRHFLGMVAVA